MSYKIWLDERELASYETDMDFAVDVVVALGKANKWAAVKIEDTEWVGEDGEQGE